MNSLARHNPVAIFINIFAEKVHFTLSELQYLRTAYQIIKQCILKKSKILSHTFSEYGKIQINLKFNFLKIAFF